MILAIKKLIVNDASQEDFFINDLAPKLHIDKKKLQIGFTLVSQYGYFWDSAGSTSTVNGSFGYERFSIKNDDTFDFYVKFKDIYTVIDKYFIKQEEYQKKEREEDLNYVRTPSRLESKLLGLGRNSESKHFDLFEETIFSGTRGYIEKIAIQASRCYKNELYDGCFVLIRRLIETLIIEAFERYGLQAKIKGKDGHYFFLSQLVGCLRDEGGWNLSRNAMECLPKLKKLGDASAHNRRFLAKKSDIDKLDLRMLIEELINLIDYPNWHSSLQRKGDNEFDAP
jgi:hypothetical protein